MLEAALSKPAPQGTRLPERLGAAIVAIFHIVERLPDKVGWVHREITRRLGDGGDPSIRRACGALVTMIDADPSTYDRHPYHNRQHYCEVALTAYFLCELERVAVQEVELLVMAALIHDVVHDGKSHRPFTLERASVERALALLVQHGVDEPTNLRIAALVLSTEPSIGTAFVAEVREFQRGVAAAPNVPQTAPELGLLIQDAALTRLARLLCEADILPSIGLTLDHAMALQRRLAEEWGRALDARDKLDFVRAVLETGPVGDFFLPNVLGLRDHLAGICDVDPED